MIGNWQIVDLSEAQRHLEYAAAYLQASISTCEQMIRAVVNRCVKSN